MATSYRLPVVSRNALAEAHGASLNGGTRELRTGPEPTLTSDADSGTLIATLTFGSPAFGSASAGTVTANAIASTTAVAAGTIAHWRDKTAGGVVRAQGNVTATAGDGSYKLDDVAPVLGQTVVAGTITHTQPE